MKCVLSEVRYVVVRCKVLRTCGVYLFVFLCGVYFRRGIRRCGERYTAVVEYIVLDLYGGSALRCV